MNADSAAQATRRPKRAQRLRPSRKGRPRPAAARSGANGLLPALEGDLGMPSAAASPQGFLRTKRWRGGQSNEVGRGGDGGVGWDRCGRCCRRRRPRTPGARRGRRRRRGRVGATSGRQREATPPWVRGSESPGGGRKSALGTGAAHEGDEPGGLGHAKG